MGFADFGDYDGSPQDQNNSVLFTNFIHQFQPPTPQLLQVPKNPSPFHISDWVGDVLDRAEQLSAQQKQNAVDRNRFRAPSLQSSGSPLLDAVDQQLSTPKKTTNFANIVKQQTPAKPPPAFASMQLPDTGAIQQQQGGQPNPILQWATSPNGQGFLTAGGNDKFDFDKFAKDPLKYLTQNNNMREFQWGLQPDTYQTLTSRGVPATVLDQLHEYLATPEGGNHAKPISAKAPGPVESVVGGSLGGLAGGALPFVNAPLAAVDMALSSENGTGVSPQELAGTALQLGVGKATGPLGEAVTGKVAAGGLKGTLADILARAGVDATANAGLTAGQITAAGQNPLSPDALKATGESAAVGGVAGLGLAGLGQAGHAFSALPEDVRTPVKIAGAGAATYGAARASGMNNEDALALATAMSSAVIAPRLVAMANRGELPEWVAAPIRNSMGSVTEMVDNEGNPISMDDLLSGKATPKPAEPGTSSFSPDEILNAMKPPEQAASAGGAAGLLTPEASDLLSKVDAGGVPGYMTNNLRRIVQENGIKVTSDTSPNDVIDALRGKSAQPEASPEPPPADTTPYRVTNTGKEKPWALEDEPPEVQAQVRANMQQREQVFGPSQPQPKSAPGAPPADLTDILGPVPDSPPASTGGLTGAPTKDVFDEVAASPNYGIPTPRQVTQVTSQMQDYLDIGEQYTDSRRLASRAFGKLGQVADPASKYKLPEEKQAFSTAVAAANLEEGTTDSVYQRIQPLRALVGDGLRRSLLKGGLEVALPAASVAAYIETDNTLPDWMREAIIAGGFGASGVLSDSYRRGFLAEKPWMNVARKATSTLDPKLAKIIDKDPNRRFYDIIENPNDYNLSPAQLKSAQAFRDLRDQRLQGDNAFLMAAGMPPIKYRLNNAIGHYYDLASLGEAGIQVGLPRELSHSDVPGILRQQGLERERVLGGTWRQVWAEHPEVKPKGDVTQLLAMELNESRAVRARSTLIKGLSDKGLAEVSILPDNATKAQQQAFAARRAQLASAGWEVIPGLDGAMIHPSAARVVKDLFQSSHSTGPLSTVMDTADAATQFVRAAMFSLDLSAFTLQGAQLFMQSPVSVLTHIVPLMRATFSEDYFQKFKASKATQGKSGAVFGANLGREFHGIEDKNLPEFIRKVENAGFGRFLPTARQIIFEHNQATENLLEKLPGGKAPVIGDALRLAELVPAAAYAGYQVKNGDDIDPTTMAVMLGIGGGIDLGREYLGRGLADHLSRPDAIKAGVRAAKATNRIGSVLNRAGMGIGAQQSKLERTALFRSPALTRNALELVGLSLMNPGAEGQFARAYLVKSAVAYVGILATAKYAATGQLDSFDPTDPNSILSVQNLAKLQIPGVDTISPSSPLLSMARAMLYQDRPDDQRDWEASRMNPLTSDFWHDKGLGIADWLTGRTPDIVGAGTNPVIENGITNLTGARIRQPVTSSSPDIQGAIGDAAQKLLPLSAQAALTTGLAQRTALGSKVSDALGVQQNSAYDTLGKQLTGLGATLGGLNVQPEYPGAALSRLRDEQTAKLTDGKVTDYFNLNNAQRGQVRDALADNPDYQKALKAVQASGKDSESPTDTYFAQRDAVNKTYTDALNQAAQQVMDGNQTQQWFKDVVKSQNDTRSAQLDQVDADFSKVSANRPGTKESVLDYLNRNERPEDKAVDGWYDLFKQATGPDGLDFDKLDQLQQAYKINLSIHPALLKYVEQQTASTAKPVNQLMAKYDQAKKDTSEFWTIQDRVFAGAQQNIPFFQQFKNLAQFNQFLQQGANATGGALSSSDVSTLIQRAVPGVKAYFDQLDYWEKKWRLTHPVGESALVQWYGFTPVDRIDYAGRETGVAQTDDARKSLLLSGGGVNSAAKTLPTIAQFQLQSGNGGNLYDPALRLALQGAYNTKK